MTPETLENPENGLELENRAGISEDALRARVVALRAALPDHSGVYCRACFRRGVTTLLEAIDIERHDVHHQVVALQAAHPPDPQPHSALSYLGGIEAALLALAE